MIRLQRAEKYFKKSGFSGAISAQNANYFTGFTLQ